MKKKLTNKVLSRRDFLRGALVAGVSTAAAGGLTACSSSQSGPEIKWDREADVVVLGTGTVAPAALVAHDAGAEVLILEKASIFGGTSSTSGGAVRVFNSYAAKEDGATISREDALAYLERVADGQASQDIMEAYIDKGNEMLEWLRDNAGFVFAHDPTPTPTFSEYYPFPGHTGPGARPNVNIVREDGVGGGRGLWMSLKEACDERGIEILFDTAGKKLVTNDDGEVIGVIAESAGQEMAVKARKAVIIGTGGFEHNKEMVRHFLRGPIYAVNTPATNTGDGHLMGMAIGADLGNMNECWGLPFFMPDPDSYTGEADWQMYRGKPGAITVNKHGERIGNESCNYDTALKAFHYYDTGTFEWRNIPGYFICDAGYTSRYPLPGSQYQVGVVPEWFVVADTLEELAAELGIDEAGLLETVEKFNENSRNGVDPQFHRGEDDFDQWTAGDLARDDIANPCLAPIETGPFCAATIWPGTCGTNGGLRTDADARVLNVWGEVIPRLYCTSNTMASACGMGYPGGGATLGTGMTFAYLAAKDAVALESWEA